jgi:hypothetical protein
MATTNMAHSDLFRPIPVMSMTTGAWGEAAADSQLEPTKKIVHYFGVIAAV